MAPGPSPRGPSAFSRFFPSPRPSLARRFPLFYPPSFTHLSLFPFYSNPFLDFWVPFDPRRPPTLWGPKRGGVRRPVPQNVVTGLERQPDINSFTHCQSPEDRQVLTPLLVSGRLVSRIPRGRSPRVTPVLGRPEGHTFSPLSTDLSGSVTGDGVGLPRDITPVVGK